MRSLAAWGTALAAMVTMVVSLPASALDTSLGFTADALPTWQANGVVWALGSAQGKVFVGGSFTRVRPPGTAVDDPASVNRSNLAVLDATTGAPSACRLDVARGTSSAIVRAVTVSPDRATVYIGACSRPSTGPPERISRPSTWRPAR